MLFICTKCGKNLSKGQKRFCSKKCNALFNVSKMNSIKTNHSKNFQENRRLNSRLCEVCNCIFQAKHRGSDKCCSWNCHKMSVMRFVPDKVIKREKYNKRNMKRRIQEALYSCNTCGAAVWHENSDCRGCSGKKRVKGYQRKYFFICDVCNMIFYRRTNNGKVCGVRCQSIAGIRLCPDSQLEKERNEKYRENNPELVKKHSKKSYERLKGWYQERHKKDCDELNNRYVNKNIYHLTGLRLADIPPELTMLKKEVMAIRRCDKWLEEKINNLTEGE